MLKNRIALLEKRMPGIRRGDPPADLSALSVEELREMESVLIKIEAGKGLTNKEEERTAVIMEKVKPGSWTKQ